MRGIEKKYGYNYAWLVAGLAGLVGVWQRGVAATPLQFQQMQKNMKGGKGGLARKRATVQSRAKIRYEKEKKNTHASKKRKWNFIPKPDNNERRAVSKTER